MRVDKPVGIWLLLFPTWWAITIASPIGLPDFYLYFLFAFGAFIMRSAGCVINDIIDVKIDKKVKRTKIRPLANGEVRIKQAYLLFVFLMFIGLIILLQLNEETIILGFLVAIPIIIYPLMKRFFALPQLFLGVVFNWGVLMGFSATQGFLDESAWLVYASAVFWTFGYDTIYAHQDKKDDKKLGIKSSALLFDKSTKVFVSVFYLLAIILLLITGYINNFSYIYYLILIIAAAHMIRQLATVNLNNEKSSLATFKSNAIFGLVVFFAVFLEKSVQFFSF